MQRAGQNHRVVRPVSNGGEPLLSGRMGVWHLHSGLKIHATDAVEMDDVEVRIELPPTVSVAILLEGRVEAVLADQPIEFTEAADARGAMWSHGETSSLARRLRRGRRIRKVIISVPPGWFDDVADGSDSMAAHLMPGHSGTAPRGVRGWRPSLASIGSAEEILAAAGEELDVTARLQLEIRGIQILRDAVSQFTPETTSATATGVSARDVGRAHAVREYVQAHTAESLSLASIARATGMSVSTLQRAFVDCFGESVMNHVRRTRLERAREALRNGGISVRAASRMAGYSSAANFATAFQRAFGYPPSRAAELG